MGLVPGVGRGLANGVHEANTLEPLIVCQLNLSDEVVKMADHRAQDKASSLWDIGANGADDRISEVGVEAVLASILIFWCLRHCVV
jgi:hypothetical protein